LEEEGFPYELLPAGNLLKYSAGKLKEHYLAPILPEEINQKLTSPQAKLIEDYVEQAGGKVF